MVNTLDKFGLGLSIVFVMLYWQMFSRGEEWVLSKEIGPLNINTNVGVAYTVTIFLVEAYVFCSLIFGTNTKFTSVVYRTIGWLLIAIGYVLFLSLNTGLDGWDLLKQRGGGFNRF